MSKQVKESAAVVFFDLFPAHPLFYPSYQVDKGHTDSLKTKCLQQLIAGCIKYPMILEDQQEAKYIIHGSYFLFLCSRKQGLKMLSGRV